MKKTVITLITALTVIFMAIPGFAGTWKQDTKGWWYENDNGSYTTNAWQTIEGKEYYFGSDGYMLANTVTPDGFQVDENGVKIITTSSANNEKASVSAEYGEKTTGGEVYITATGKKYHSISNCGSTNPAKTGRVTVSEAKAMGLDACSKCYK